MTKFCLDFRFPRVRSVAVYVDRPLIKLTLLGMYSLLGPSCSLFILFALTTILANAR